MPEYAITPDPNPVASGTTDSNGEIEFNNLGIGFYAVRCLEGSNPDYFVEIDKWTFIPSTTLIKFNI